MGGVELDGIEPRPFRTLGSFLETFLDIIDLRLPHLVGNFSPQFGDGRRRPWAESAVDRAPGPSARVADLNPDLPARFVDRIHQALPPGNLGIVVNAQHKGV
jgi:hypothetical protein